MKRLSLATAVVHTLTGLLSVFLPTVAAAEALRQQTLVVEVFRMSLDDWHRIPTTVRDDHRQLYEKCRSAVGRGKVERIDRIGGGVETGAKSTFESMSETTYPTSFGANGEMLMPDSWEMRNVGSTMECELMADAALRIQYEYYPQPVLWVPLLERGPAANIRRSEVPIFNFMRIMSSRPGSSFAGPALLAAIPVPASGERATQLALIFTVGNGNGKPPTPVASDTRFEVLVVRGPSGGGKGDPSASIESLLKRSGAVETILALPMVVNQRVAAESVTDWIYPTSSSTTGNVFVPEELDTLNQGSTLDVECLSVAADACQVSFLLEYDLRKPLLPVVSGREGTVTPATPARFKITLKERLNLVLGAWTAIKEIPLEPILGARDVAAKGQSCHVFARVHLTGGNADLSGRPTPDPSKPPAQPAALPAVGAGNTVNGGTSATPPRAGDSFRRWTDMDGEEIEAQLVGTNSVTGGVRLRLRTGIEQDIPLSRLCEADRSFVATWKPEGKEEVAVSGAGWKGVDDDRSSTNRNAAIDLVRIAVRQPPETSDSIEFLASFRKGTPDRGTLSIRIDNDSNPTTGSNGSEIAVLVELDEVEPEVHVEQWRDGDWQTIPSFQSRAERLQDQIFVHIDGWTVREFSYSADLDVRASLWVEFPCPKDQASRAITVDGQIGDWGGMKPLWRASEPEIPITHSLADPRSVWACQQGGSLLLRIRFPDDTVLWEQDDDILAVGSGVGVAVLPSGSPPAIPKLWCILPDHIRDRTGGEQSSSPRAVFKWKGSDMEIELRDLSAGGGALEIKLQFFSAKFENIRMGTFRSNRKPMP